MTTPAQNVFLVIGTNDAQTSLVGIGLDLVQAQSLINRDYGSLVNANGGSFIDMPLNIDEPEEDGTESYWTHGYQWIIKVVPSNQVVNFTL